MEDVEPPSYEAAMSENFPLPSAPPILLEDELENEQSLFCSLSEEEIRDASFKHAEKNFKKNFTAVKQMKFTNICSTCSFHYKLETFTEKRQIATRISHYNNEKIDGTKNGPEPDPWSITTECPNHFQDHKVGLKIPHTEQVKTCHNCDGRGKESCLSCNGAGWTYCQKCGTSNNGCSYCKSSLSRLPCQPCHEKGQIKCRTCNGGKKLKYFKEVIVTWKTHVDDFIQNSTKIPDEVLKSSTNKEIFRDERPMIHPLQNFHLSHLINDASLDLIQKHRRLYATEEVIRFQRQTILAVPITRVNYKYKDSEGEFYVFGVENNVHFENTLPKSNSCCIS